MMSRRYLGCVLVLAACGGDGTTRGGAGSDGGPIDAGPTSSIGGSRSTGGQGASDDGGGGSSNSGGTSAGGDAATAAAGGLANSGGSAGVTGGGGSSAAGGNAGAGGGTGSEEACDATCHFVRAGAAGDGTTWTSAWTQLPDTLERGHRYYVADGDYPGYDFDDAASADTPIVVRKATASRHGSGDGWLPEYGDGTAVFGTLTVRQPYFEIDGTERLGFRAVGGFQGTVVDINADHVTVRHVDIDGAFGTDAGGVHSSGACTGLSVGGSYVTVAHSEIHDVADDGVSASGLEELDFVGNTVHALHACGTDGGCGPCYNGHSDGIELYDVVRSRFVGNFVYDVRSTATVFFGNWADSLGNGRSDYCEDVVLANNIFYAPEVGLVAYLQDVAGIEVYQNTFWGLRQGGYGGLSVGPNVTGLRLYNNVILSINTTHTGGAFDGTEHASDYNLYGSITGQWTEGPNSVVAPDPGFVGIPDMNGPAVATPTPADFALSSGSPAIDRGLSSGSTLPTDDFFGAARDGSPDIGAVEFR